MDVAWMLGSGSTAGDWELRISMRSFRTYYLAVARPWIIGHIPDWIDRTKVRCLPWPDPYRRCKDANLLQKALRLAMEPQISNPFILCSDDHILLRPSLPAEFRLWHRGEIAEDPDEDAGQWERRLVNTGRILRNHGYPAKNFDGHVPYPVKKEWIRHVLRFDFGEQPGMCLFSTILNCSGQPAFPLSSDRIRGWLGSNDMAEDVVDAKLAKNQFACLNEDSMDNRYVISRLEQLFPEPAPWEIDATRRAAHSRMGTAASSAACMFGS